MKNDTATAPLPKELLEELKVLVTQAETMMNGGSSDTLGHLRARFDSAQECFSTFYTDTKNHVVAGAKTTDIAIRENPYQALAIALGVGALLGSLTGLLLGRRGV